MDWLLLLSIHRLLLKVYDILIVVCIVSRNSFSPKVDKKICCCIQPFLLRVFFGKSLVINIQNYFQLYNKKTQSPMKQLASLSRYELTQWTATCWCHCGFQCQHHDCIFKMARIFLYLQALLNLSKPAERMLENIR